MDVTDISGYRKARQRRNAQELLAELNYLINYSCHLMPPEMVVGALASQLGRLIQVLPNNEQLLEKAVATVELYAEDKHA